MSPVRWPDWARPARLVALATLLAVSLAARGAWGHKFPELRTVVVQAEPCSLALLVSYKPAAGEATEALLARASGAQGAQAVKALRDALAASAMTGMTIAVDGEPLPATSAEAKLAIEPGGLRPMVIMLVAFALPAGKTLSISTRDPHSTRFSWTDRSRGRIASSGAPSQRVWRDGVASFLLPLAAGDTTCATSKRSSPSAPRSVP